MSNSRDEKLTQPKQNINAMLEHANALLLDLERINLLNNNNQQDVQVIAKNLRKNLQHLRKQIEQQHQHKLRTHLKQGLSATLKASLAGIDISDTQKQQLLHNLDKSVDASLAEYELDTSIEMQFETLLQDINLLIELHR